jgi:hypothetical protein
MFIDFFIFNFCNFTHEICSEFLNIAFASFVHFNWFRIYLFLITLFIYLLNICFWCCFKYFRFRILVWHINEIDFCLSIRIYIICLCFFVYFCVCCPIYLRIQEILSFRQLLNFQIAISRFNWVASFYVNVIAFEFII